MAQDGKVILGTFMMAIIIALLGGIASLIMYSNNQIWTKLDRVVSLIVREADNLNKRCDYNLHRVDKADERINGVEKEVKKK